MKVNRQQWRTTNDRQGAKDAKGWEKARYKEFTGYGVDIDQAY